MSFSYIKLKEIIWCQQKYLNKYVISPGWTCLDYPDSTGVFKNTHQRLIG